MSEKQRSEIRVLAGVKFTRRHVPNPVDNVGRYGDHNNGEDGDNCECDDRKCVWEHGPGGDRRRDDEFKTFSEFRNSLGLSCEEDSEPALLQVRAGVRGVGGDDGVAGDPQHHVARRGLLQQLHHPLHGLEDSHRGQLQTEAQEAGLRCGLAGQTGSCQLAGQSGHLSAGIVSNNLHF